MFVGKDAVLERHKRVLNEAEGHLAAKPPAKYEIKQIFGSSHDGNARALIHWAYPSDGSVVYDDKNAQEGFFIFNFLKRKSRWSVVSLKNTPALGTQLNPSESKTSK